MDVRFYPAAGGNSIPGDTPNLDFGHCLGYYNFNKFQNNNNYMNMAEANGALLNAGDTFHTPSLGDEEFEIPPITPPPETESGMSLSEVVSPYPGMSEHSHQHRGHLLPQFPPQSLELPSITISRNAMDQEGGPGSNGQSVNVGPGHMRQYHPNPAMVMKSIINMHSPNGMMQRNQLSTINQSQINGQLSLNMGGHNIAHTSPSPPASKSATPSPSSSINEDDQDDTTRMIGEKRPAPVDPSKKPKTPKKKKKKDPNEPQKPVSAYALFFRDTQAAIKGQNPNATFGEVSKIVASMWDGLGEEQKQVYKSKTEAAKKEYLKALAAYRASLVSKAAAESAEAQTIRTVQQTLASTSLSPGMVLPSPLNQHPSMPSASQALQQAIPRAIAPKPLQMRLGGSQIVTSVTVSHQNMSPGMPPQMLGQMGAGGGMVGGQSSAVSQMSPPMQMHPQQMHQQQIQQQMQQQHFQHHLQQQLQQQHQQHLHHQQSLHHPNHFHHQQQLQHLQHQAQCTPHSPPHHSPSTPHSAPIGSPQPAPQQQAHPSQIQAHAQVLSQVSIY
ncbi:TOX high mobility group box family member 3 [Periophthalmus magnuspinnatus]|uniref:TOX high mobility group box family member 3 n=1 Tax=Periophthalmus magnuspinnatus TaxID=409849 RepID=UPI00145BF6E2|nr:TOX high mobility group box family member 3 [Periophthalmus magnuspinnatus]